MRNLTGTISNALGCTVERNTESTGSTAVTDEPGPGVKVGDLRTYSDVR